MDRGAVREGVEPVAGAEVIAAVLGIAVEDRYQLLPGDGLIWPHTAVAVAGENVMIVGPADAVEVPRIQRHVIEYDLRR